jgi:hypothetical protein
MADVHESLGTLEDLFGVANPKMAPIVKKAHKLILSIHPDAAIVPRLGEKSICYGFGPKKMSESYCYLIPFKDYVNLGFFHGVAIDPDGVLEGTGAKMRHIKISSAEQLSSPKVSKFIKAALKERKAALGR